MMVEPELQERRQTENYEEQIIELKRNYSETKRKYEDEIRSLKKKISSYEADNNKLNQNNKLYRETLEENNSLKEKVILLQNDSRSEVTPPKEEPDNLAENEGNFNKFNQEETFNQNMMMSEDRASMDTNTVQKHGSNIQHFNNYQITSERSVNTLGLLSPQSSNQPFSQHKNHYELKELVYSNEEYQNVNTEEMLEKNQIDESFAQKYLSPMNQKKNMTILTSKEVNLENERNAALMSPTSDINVSKASSLKQEIDNLDNEIRHLQGKLKYMIENKKKE